MINLSDTSVSDVINSEMSDYDYVATSRDKLYYTTYHKHTVTCCDLHGTTQWEFKDIPKMVYLMFIIINDVAENVVKHHILLLWQMMYELHEEDLMMD
jgi:hypothetical protein